MVEGDLPPAVGLLWGRRERPRRGPRPELTVDAIVEVAVRLADAEGLGAVSMARVASELGFTPMSLYRYVAGKDELFLLMVDAALRDDVDPRGSDETWREALERWAMAQVAVLERHPWYVHLPITGLPVSPSQIRWLDHGLQALSGTGLSEPEKAGVVGLVASYLLGEARLRVEAGDAVRSGASAPSPQVYTAMLDDLIDADGYPGLHAAVRAGAFDDVPDEAAESLDWGLGIVLDGVEKLIESRGPS